MLIYHTLIAQDIDSLQKRKRIVGWTAGTGYVATMGYLSFSWYESAGTGFRWFNDGEEWYGLDKLGHIFSSYHVSYNLSDALEWAGYNNPQYLAAGLSFAGVGMVEVLDGFAPGYGASAYDLIANTAGIGLFLVQYNMKSPLIVPRFSFQHTPYAAERPSLLGQSWYDRWLKDYNGQTYWMSIQPGSIFGDWPGWLTVDIGYGAYGMVAARNEQSVARGFTPGTEWYLSPGINWGYFKTLYPKLTPLLRILNMLKMPLPTLGWRNGSLTFYPLYF